MYRGSRPRILPVFITIIVVVVVIAILVTLVRSVLNRSSSTESTEETHEQSLQAAVIDQGTTRSVSWVVRGPIVANENFRSYQIEVTPTSRTYTVYSGYLDKVESQKTYDNNSQAYEQFTYALDLTGVGTIRGNKEDEADIRGVCATDGLAYTFETANGTTTDHAVWSSTCKDSVGTLSADPLKIQALFVNQIPDFKPIFNNIY